MENHPTIKDASNKMDKAVDHVMHEFSSIHTGKASPTMVESLMVDVYGSMMRIKEVAAITTPDHRTIMIQPWDKGVVNEVTKAIQKANIGLNPVAAGTNIRCPIPELSRERRQELVKTTHTMAEDGRIRVRNIRREAIDELKKGQKAGDISEDELKRLEKEVQNITDKHIANIATHLESKEKELMQV